jgi:hypothetical protein
MKKTTVGSGLTQMSVLTHSIEELVRTAREDPTSLRKRLPTYPTHLLRWRDWATGVLEKAGRPTDNRLVEKKRGTWAYASEVDPRLSGPLAGSRLIAGLDYSDNEEEETLEWYASQIIKLVDHELALSSVKKEFESPHSETIRLTPDQRRLANLASRGTACHLGCLVERVRWKFRYEKAALHGLARADSWKARQAAGASARRQRGHETAKHIEELVINAVRKSPKSFLQGSDAQIIRRIRRLGSKAEKKISDSTFYRHFKTILPRLRG